MRVFSNAKKLNDQTDVFYIWYLAAQQQTLGHY